MMSDLRETTRRLIEMTELIQKDDTADLGLRCAAVAANAAVRKFDCEITKARLFSGR